MTKKTCWAAAAGLLWLLSLVGVARAATATPVLNSVTLVSNAAGAVNPVPPAQTFTITQAGSYSVTLSDLKLPSALGTLSAAIVTSTDNLVTLSSAGSKTVTLAAGTYTAQVLAIAAPGAVGGTFSIQVAPAAGGATVFQYEDSVGAANPAPITGQSVLSTKLSIASAGTYQLTVTDLAFPTALSSLRLLILNDCGTTPGCVTAPVAPTPLSGPAISSQLSLAAGTYDLFIEASANSTALQGLYSVQIAPVTTGPTVYSATVPVGELPAPIPLSIASAGSVSLQLTDLATPAALSSIQAVAAQGANVLQQVAAAGTYSFSAAAGSAQLYVVATAGGGGQGGYEAFVTSGGQTVADVAQPVLASGSYGYAFSTKLAAAGSYQLTVFDFQTPVQFSALSGVATQAGKVLTMTQGTGSFTAAAGPLNVLVFPAFGGSDSSANGLFSVQVMTQSTGVIAYETTQGVGALFSSQVLNISTAGEYDLTLTDLVLPAVFSEIGVIITRGDSKVAQVFGDGLVPFQVASPGTYVLNVYAETGSIDGVSVDYGLYGLQVAPAPAAPTVTLSASSTNITGGQSVTLTWTSTGASSCNASVGWTGGLATSGSKASGALTATTSFTITCDGAGGTATTSVSVNVNPAQKSGGGGGGSLSVEELLCLVLALVWRRRATLLPAADASVD
jgi:hypothetical protein